MERIKKTLPSRSEFPMIRPILIMWYLAMSSEDFNRLNRSVYVPGQTRLRTEYGFSPVGVLCDLYCRTWGEDRWVKTNLGWEWDGIWLGECPDDVICWAFDLENYGMSADNRNKAIKLIRKKLFDFDCWADTKKEFPGYIHLVRVFGEKC